MKTIAISRMLLCLFCVSVGLQGPISLAQDRQKTSLAEIAAFERAESWFAERDHSFSEIAKELELGHSQEAFQLAKAMVEKDQRTIDQLSHISPEHAPPIAILVSSLARLGETAIAADRVDDAVEAYKQRVEIATKAFPSDHALHVSAQRDLDHAQQIKDLPTSQRRQLAAADVAERQYSKLAGDLQQVILQAEEVLATRRSLLGEKNLTTLRTLTFIGFQYARLMNWGKTAEFYQRAAPLTKEVFGENHPRYADSLNNLGYLYWQTNKYESALAAYLAAKAIREKTFGKQSVDYAQSLGNLASLYSSQGDYAKAEVMYLESLTVNRKVYGPEHAIVAQDLHNLGTLYESLKNFERALEVLEQAQAIFKEHHPRHPTRCTNLSILGGVYLELGRGSLAIETLQAAVELAKDVHGSQSLQYVNYLNNLAYGHATLGNYRGSERVYREIIQLFDQPNAAPHGWFASGLNNLSYALSRQGKDDEAAVHGKRAAEMSEVVFGHHHPETEKNIRNYASNLAKLGRHQEAIEGLETARKIMHKHIHDVLPGFSEPEMHRFLRRLDLPALRQSLAIASKAARSNEENVAQRATEWLVNGKAVLHESIAERLRLEHMAKTGEHSELATRLLEVRYELSNLSVAGALNAAGKERLADLQATESQLSKQLSRSSSHHQRSVQWLTYDQLEKYLGEEETLIEIARVEIDQQGAAEYLAFVIQAGNPPQMITLGDAASIDQALTTAEKAIAETPYRLQQKTAQLSDDELMVQGLLRQVAERVFLPLVPLIGERRKLIIAPDSALWAIPWEVFPLDEDRYLTEEFRCRYVLSGRYLAEAQPLVAEEVKRTEAVVFADPAYGTFPSSRRTPEARVPGSFVELMEIRRLPGTVTEARLYEQNLREEEISLRILQSSQATEDAFRQLVSPGLLVFSTHGFFFRDKVPEDNRNDGNGTLIRDAPARDHEALTHPFLRCGLALAGCNDRTNSGDDGFLTGVEVLNSDLSQSKLVVLSACNTASGDIRDSEGAIGLRSAFLLAGSRGVIASCWEASDAEFVSLTNSFLKFLRDGQSATFAIGSAQRERIKTLRNRFGAAHPFFWGAFTFTGNDSVLSDIRL